MLAFQSEQERKRAFARLQSELWLMTRPGQPASVFRATSAGA